MAEQSFKFKVDYKEFEEAQRSVAKLKSEMSDFSGTKKEFQDMTNELNGLRSSIDATAKKAAEDWAKMNQSMKGVDFPAEMSKGLKDFDKDIEKYANNQVAYFQKLREEGESQLGVVQDLATRWATVKVTPENANEIKKVSESLYKTSEELLSQNAVLAQNEAAWKQISDAVKNGTQVNVEASKAVADAYIAFQRSSTDNAQIMLLQQETEAERAHGAVIDANRQKVAALADQALNTVIQLRDMGNSLRMMGVDDSGFAEKVNQLEQAALNLGGSSNVEAAQAIANEVKAVFESAMATMKGETTNIASSIRSQQNADDAEMIAGIREQKQLIAEKEKERAEEKAHNEQKLASLQKELQVLNEQKSTYEEMRQALANAKEGDRSINLNGTEMPIGEARREVEAYDARLQSLQDRINEVKNAEAASAKEASQYIDERNQKIESYKSLMSVSALGALESAEKMTAAEKQRAQAQAEREEQAKKEQEARAAATKAEDEAILKQIDGLQGLIGMEKERNEVLAKQVAVLEAAREKSVSQGTLSFQEGYVSQKTVDSRQGELEASTQKIEKYKDEVEGLKSKLSEAGQAQADELIKLHENADARDDLIRRLKEEKEGLNGEAESARQASGALSETSEAMKRIKADELANNLRQGSEELNTLAQRLAETKRELNHAESEFAAAKSRAMKGEGSDADALEGYNKAKDKVEAVRSTFEKLADDYNKAKADQDELNKKYQEAQGHQERMRTQIMNTREELMRMIAAGQSGSPAFQQLAIKAGEMRRQMNLANAQMQYFANPQRHLAALKTGMQGVAGAAGLVTGAMGLFNTESKKMQEIQTKIQSIMAIVVGLETTYNTVKQSSTFMLAIQEVRTWLVAKATTAEAVATEEATVAQEGLNVAMTANPIGAVVVVVVALTAALAALASAYMGVSDSAIKAGEKTAAMAQELGKAHGIAARTIVDSIDKYNTLKKSFEKARSEGQNLNKWIKTHKNAMEQLGLDVKDVSSAEKYFIKQTDVVYEALMLRAKAAAYAAVKMQTLQKYLSLSLAYKAGKYNEYEGAAKVGDKVDRNIALQLGLNARNIDLGGYSLESQAEVDKYNKYMMNKKLWDIFAVWNEAKMGEQQAEKEFKDFVKKNDVKLKSNEELKDDKIDNKEPKEKKKREKKEKNHQNDEWEAREEELEQAKKDKEDKIKFDREYENRVTKASIDLMNEGYAKRKRQEEFNAKKEKEDIVQRYKDLAQARIEEEKKQFDKDEAAKLKKNPKYKKEHYYESDKYKAHFSGNDPKNGELLLDEDETKGFITESYLADLKARQADIKLKEDYLKDQTKYFGKELTIRRKYDQERAKLQEEANAGFLDNSTPEYEKKLAQINKKEADELKKLELEDFKGSAMFASVLGDGSADAETIEKFKTKMESLLAVAANEMTPTDFNAFADMYKRFSDRLIELDPFGALKQSLEDYKLAQAKLATAKQEREALTAVSPDGTIKDADIVLGERRGVVNDARENVNAWQEKLQNAEINGAPEEELTEIRESLANATDFLVQEEVKYNAVQQSIKDADNKVANAEKGVAMARNGLKKSMKTVGKMAKQLTDAFADLASNVSAPFGQLIGEVGSLITATIDGIDTIEMAAESGAKGIKMVGMAVQSAVAILAIIQAVWTMVETIINLVSGADAEKYQEKIDGLQGKISALDWLFNKLKDDMDNAWGTDAIDAYGRALDALADKQKASIELIQTQADKVDGHHSLHYYFSEKAGISKAELSEAKKLIAELGGNVSEGQIWHWLYSLSPAQLRDFMDSGIGTTIMGKLGGVAGTGDYSGSDWQKDMQAYADSVKSLEELSAEMAEKLNGISLDGFRDEFKELVTTVTTSLNDINNSFDEIMREAMYNKFSESYNKEMEVFYNRLKDLNEDYTREDGISTEEYRRRLEELRRTWTMRTKQAQDEYQEALTMAGINATDIEQDATSGGFETMSEDTATELNGRFASMQAMETVTAESVSQLVGLQTNITNIADEIRTIQVNALLELQAISENTKKIYLTVDEMQGDVKTIKDNTDRL